ncbi:glucosyltransferase domain-containing protein [Enterobacter wuhouensis]
MTDSNVWAFFKNNRRPILWVFGLCILYVLPIIMADRLYVDDLGRTTLGYYGWIGNGRPLAEVLMLALSFGGLDLDVSPLPLLIAVIIYSIVSVAYVKSIIPNKNALITVIASLSFILNPFYLENLSYKYDALPMMFSVCILLLAYLNISNICFRIALPIICVMASLSSYQASIGLFVSLAIIEAVASITKGAALKTASLRVAERAVGFGIGYLLYDKLIKPATVLESNGYTWQHSQTITLNGEGLGIFLRNINIYLEKIMKYVNSMPNIIIWLVVIFMVVSLVSIVFGIFTGKKSKLEAILCSAVVISSPLIVFSLTFIHMCLLVYPIASPRVFVSFSAFVFLLIALPFMHDKFNKASFAPAIIFVAFSYVYVFSYGNALKFQDEFEKYVAVNIANDLSNIDPYGKLKIQTNGYMDYPQQVSLVINKYPAMKDAILRYLNNDWYWAYFQLGKFGVRNDRARLSAKYASEISNDKALLVRRDYSFHKRNNILVIQFHGKY